MTSLSSQPKSSARAPGRRAFVAVVVVTFVLLGARWLLVHHPSGAAASAPPPAPVAVATPLVRNVTVWDDYVGRFRASQAVEVRPRVPGQITGIHFTDGQIVKKGQLLFTIDDRRFQAGQNAARADVESARSGLALAQADLERGQRLTGDNSLSGAELDQLRAKTQSAKAAADAAQARLRDRNLDVDFAEVRAPISGRVSDRRVDIGNQVAGAESNSGTLLTTIQALDPIYFDFDASEALFLKTQRERQATGSAPVVQIRLQDEPAYNWTGKLDFTDNTINPHAGTIRGRATIANPSGFLRPGLFGNMRAGGGGGMVRALLVPDAAVQTDQARQIVLVVDNTNTVSAKEVIVGPLVDGLRVIRSGLSDRDRVVVDGIGATPGAKVNPHAGKITPTPAAQPAFVEAPAASQATLAP
jgi:multidrug efflux system membrane fusion protein